MIWFVSDKYTHEFVNVIRYALLQCSQRPTMPILKKKKKRKRLREKGRKCLFYWLVKRYLLLTWFVLGAHPGTFASQHTAFCYFCWHDRLNGKLHNYLYMTCTLNRTPKYFISCCPERDCHGQSQRQGYIKMIFVHLFRYKLFSIHCVTSSLALRTYSIQFP